MAVGGFGLGGVLVCEVLFGVSAKLNLRPLHPSTETLDPKPETLTLTPELR